MTIDRYGRLLLLGQGLDAGSFLLFVLLFGDLVTTWHGVERGGVALAVLDAFGVAGLVVFKVGASVAAAAWPWHPERYRRWPVVSPARSLLMVACGLSGLVGAAFNALAIVQVGSALW